MGIIVLDPWQRAVLEHQGNVCIRAGRQVGKTEVISLKAAQFARDRSGTVTLVIAASQKQSGWLFDRIKGQIDNMEAKKEIKYARESTRTRIWLSNGSEIHSLPAGRTGQFIRGLTLDLLIADEAAYIPEEVWRAVTPMIAVSRKLRGLGWVILLSTPFGKGGYFYESYVDPDFKSFHVSSEKCKRIPKDFLLKEKKRMTKAEYAQEYLGDFIDEWNQFFPTPLIKACMTFIHWDFEKEYNQKYSYYLGVDIARYGGEENAFVVIEHKEKKLRVVKVLTTDRVSLIDTVERIKALDKKFDFRRVFIDSAGVGGGALDLLIESMGRKVVGLENASRSIDKEGTRRRILKEDLYSSALCLMEARKVEIVSHPRLLRSLKSIVFEYTLDKNLKISGKYAHLAEAFVRACWSIKDRGLRVFLA